jgi:hypothetical protein
MIFQHSIWGLLSIVLAIIFSFIAANLYPNNIFIALNEPIRDQSGLADTSPVLAVMVQDQIAAYPLKILIPHHIINDILGGIPVLVSW